MSAVDIAIEEGVVTVAVPDVSVGVSAPTVAVDVVTSGPPGADAVLPPESDAKGNTSYGVESQTVAPAGDQNTAYGWRAQYGITGGGYNTAVGPNSMRYLTIGSSNTAIGNAALYSNDRGGSNVAVGETALYGLWGGSANVAVGNGALEDTTTAYNTGVGYQSKQYVGSVDFGAGLGAGTRFNRAGTALGAYSEARGVQSTAVGYAAIATLDNQVMLGTAAQRVYAPGGIDAQGLSVGKSISYGSSYSGIDVPGRGGVYIGNAADPGIYISALDATGVIVLRPGSGSSQEFVIGGAAVTSGTPIVLPADPTTALQAATKQYVDTHPLLASLDARLAAVEAAL